MNESSFTCPRCLHTTLMRPDLQFCPHCGLANAVEAADQSAPTELNVNGVTYEVRDRIAVGSIAKLYRCLWNESGRQVQGVLKIVGDARANSYLIEEASTLTRLNQADAHGRYIPFLPTIVESFGMRDPDAAPDAPGRQANILRYHHAIQSPDELYSLAEVKAYYRGNAALSDIATTPANVDPRHVAWIWRRLLSILSFAHFRHVVHGAVLPMHVLIEPKEHKLVLIDWCWSTSRDNPPLAPPVLSGGYERWYRRDQTPNQPATQALDISFGARCMIDLLGGDPLSGKDAIGVDPALIRYFSRCFANGSAESATAGRWLEDFDRLIQAMWGPRQFIAMDLPPRKPGV